MKRKQLQRNHTMAERDTKVRAETFEEKMDEFRLLSRTVSVRVLFGIALRINEGNSKADGLARRINGVVRLEHGIVLFVCKIRFWCLGLLWSFKQIEVPAL